LHGILTDWVGRQLKHYPQQAEGILPSKVCKFFFVSLACWFKDVAMRLADVEQRLDILFPDNMTFLKAGPFW
jgi:hypothetical protein